jgi:N-methylhydantoinase A
LKDNFVRSSRIKLEKTSLAVLRDHLSHLMAEATAWFVKEEIKRSDRALYLSFDMRYVGQNFELPVAVGSATSGKVPTLIDVDRMRTRFYAVHDQFYGFHNESDEVEIVNIRLTASAATTRLNAIKAEKVKSRPAPVENRPAWFSDSRPSRTPVYDRTELRAGQEISGPAIIEQFDSTTVLYPKDRLVVDSALNLLIEVAP